MFGLKALFAALARLTGAVNRSADLFEQANEHLSRQLGIEETPTLTHEAEDDHLPVPARNGRKAKSL